MTSAKSKAWKRLFKTAMTAQPINVKWNIGSGVGKKAKKGKVQVIVKKFKPAKDIPGTFPSIISPSESILVTKDILKDSIMKAQMKTGKLQDNLGKYVKKVKKKAAAWQKTYDAYNSVNPDVNMFNRAGAAGDRKLLQRAKKVYEGQVSAKAKLLRKLSDIQIDYDEALKKLNQVQETAAAIESRYKSIGRIADVGGEGYYERKMERQQQLSSGQLAKQQLQTIAKMTQDVPTGSYGANVTGFEPSI